MESLIKLTRNMQAGEIKLLRHFFRMQQVDDKKRNLLFDRTIKLKNCKDIAGLESRIIKTLYAGSKNAEKSFEKLKSRLRMDILNVLLYQESSFRDCSKNEKAIYTYKRLMLQGDILLKRGLYQEASTVLKKASAIAQSNELYVEQLLIDTVRSNYNITKRQEDDFMQYSNKIRTASSQIEKLMLAKHFYEELLGYTMFRLGEEPPFEEWKKKLADIESYSVSSGSAKIKFYFNICALYFYRHSRQYETSLQFGLALLKQQESSEMLRAFLYAGTVHLEVSRCFLLMKQYNTAVYHASYSIENFGGDMRTILSSLEVLFYSYINTGDYKNAIAVTEKAFANSYLQKDKFMKSKWWFLKAGVEFKMLNYKASIVSLKKCDELYKDKSQWMLACSIFETICRIENGDQEWFEYRSEGLRKIMERHNKGRKDAHNKRFGLIYEILKTLNKNNFDFSRTLAEEKNNIELLADGDENYLWNLAGCEIVRFDEWIKQKAISACKAEKARMIA
ncbi:MAG: hypothetical protein ACXVP0_01795 [Bacteroidia bacterium]